MKTREKTEKYEEDFERWCRECVTVTDKLTGAYVPFQLNAPQRRVAALMERERRAGRPIRIIMLKARQWGGSTLVEIYMAWLQLVRHEGWNSVICAHVRDVAASIKGMYTRLLSNYPVSMKYGDVKKWNFAPYEKSTWINTIAARRAIVALASAQAPNSLRGSAFHLAHLSEVAFWEQEGTDSATEVVRMVSGTVPPEPETLVVMESTANGTDNYFYREWQRAVKGESDKLPVFVPWHEIEIYRRELTGAEREKLPDELTDYERQLQASASLSDEQIAWYHYKRREYPTDEAMMAEFPSTPDEAFATSGKSVFSADEIPRIAAQADDTKPRLAVLIPGDKTHHHLLALFSQDGKGRICCLAEYMEQEAISAFMQRVSGYCRRESVPLAIAEMQRSSGTSHSRWCRRKARAENISLHYNDDDSDIVILDRLTLGEVTDSHRELLAAGMIVEMKEDIAQEYRNFRGSNVEACPRLTARMVASHLLYPFGSNPASPADFLE